MRNFRVILVTNRGIHACTVWEQHEGDAKASAEAEAKELGLTVRKFVSVQPL